MKILLIEVLQSRKAAYFKGGSFGVITLLRKHQLRSWSAMVAPGIKLDKRLSPGACYPLSPKDRALIHEWTKTSAVD